MNPREHAGPIQRAFAGLLGFLDLKGFGLAPNSIRGDVSPVLDVEKYLLAGQYKLQEFYNPALPIISLNSVFSLAGNGTLDAIVPDGKCWLVRGITSWITANPGDTIGGFGIAIGSAPGMGPYALALSREGPEVASIITYFPSVYAPSQPLLLTAGMRIGVHYQEANFAAAPPFWCDVLYAEFNA